MSVGENSLRRASKAVKKNTETVIIPSEQVEEKIIQPIEKKVVQPVEKEKTVGIGDAMPVHFL